MLRLRRISGRLAARRGAPHGLADLTGITLALLPSPNTPKPRQNKETREGGEGERREGGERVCAGVLLASVARMQAGGGGGEAADVALTAVTVFVPPEAAMDAAAAVVAAHAQPFLDRASSPSLSLPSPSPHSPPVLPE